MFRILKSKIVTFSIGYFFFKWFFCRSSSKILYSNSVQKIKKKQYEYDDDWGQFIDIDIYN